MKKHVLILLVFTTVIACNKEDLEFSCNPVINEYVKSNILKLSQISIDEFLIFDTSVQRAAFRSFSAERKFELW